LRKKKTIGVPLQRGAATQGNRTTIKGSNPKDHVVDRKTHADGKMVVPRAKKQKVAPSKEKKKKKWVFILTGFCRVKENESEEVFWWSKRQKFNLDGKESQVYRPKKGEKRRKALFI